MKKPGTLNTRQLRGVVNQKVLSSNAVWGGRYFLLRDSLWPFGWPRLRIYWLKTVFIAGIGMTHRRWRCPGPA